VNGFGHGRKNPPQVANKFEGRRKLIIYFQMGSLNPKPYNHHNGYENHFELQYGQGHYIGRR
jgi:hypothetical protein